MGRERGGPAGDVAGPKAHDEIARRNVGGKLACEVFLDHGADSVAIVTDILKAPNPEARCRALLAVTRPRDRAARTGTISNAIPRTNPGTLPVVPGWKRSLDITFIILAAPVVAPVMASVLPPARFTAPLPRLASLATLRVPALTVI